VDAALAEARKAIYADGNNLEWGTPVLFLRAQNGQIFDVTPSPRPAEPLIRQPPITQQTPTITPQVAHTESEGELGTHHVTDTPEALGGQPQPVSQLDAVQQQRQVAWRQPGLLLGGVLLLMLALLWQGSRWFNAPFSGVDNMPPTLTSTPATAVALPGQPPTSGETVNVQALTQTAEAAGQTATPTATSSPAPVATATSTLVPTFTFTPSPTPANTPLPIDASTLPSSATQTNPKDGAIYVWIPPGEFTMGSSDEDELAFNNEKPQRTVEVDGFWIMRTEVTNAQYARCLQERGCKTEPNNDNWNNPEYANHPVTQVTWHQARDYTTWVGGRLPTEAEWEKACHGPDARLYPWGDQAPNDRLLNYNSNVENTTSVGSYPAGANSLYDMAGNVWEWTADWHDENYYANAPSSNPKGPEGGTHRTLRGGSFSAGNSRVRCTTREPGDPSIGYARVGFRVVSPDL
jgi:formylglycine-generating enzyme required for sulfatase activity